MSAEKNVQTVKNLFVAISRGDRDSLLTLDAEDIEWIIPGSDWPLAGTHRGRAGVAAASEGLRGCAEDHFVFATTVRDGKLTNIRECIDTQALARAAERNASAPAQRRPSRLSSRSMANEPWTAALHVVRSSNTQP